MVLARQKCRKQINYVVITANDDLEVKYLQLEPMDFTEEELATSRLVSNDEYLKQALYY